MASESKRVTLDDVAAAAGVSRMTASYSYNRPDRVAASTRRRVLAAADELGFLGPDPSGRFLRQGALRSLGLVLGESLNYVFDDPQASRFVAGLAHECTAAGYGLTLIPTTLDDRDASHVMTAAVDAFVLWTTTADDPALAAVRTTHRRGVIHGGPAVEGFTTVGIDNRAAARTLALTAWQSAQTPAVVSFPLDRERTSQLVRGIDPATAAYPVTRDRLAGFRDAAHELGIDWNDVLVAVCARNHLSDAREATRALLTQEGGVDGICTMSDQQALAARDALLEGGRDIPGDVTLGGFDGSELAEARDITSIHQSLFDQGVRAARVALDRTGADDPADTWQLISRGSTAR